jgi:hypothetical protein
MDSLYDAAISISNDHGDGTGEFHCRAALIWSAQVVLPGAGNIFVRSMPCL